MNYYESLGVPNSATADEIKRAYRKLASQHHPDKGGDKAKFQEIQTAYDTLSNDSKRQQYDMQLSGRGAREFHFHSTGAGHPNIDEIFRSFGFGEDPFSGFRQQQRRNKDLRINIPVPLASTLQEQKKTISVSTTNREQTTVEVTIPRGITSGTNIRYTRLGDNLFNTIPRGDLYVQISVHGAENFIVNGIDLYTPLSVNCLLAIAGGTVVVVGLDERTFELTIPSGTQAGTRFRLGGQGLYRMNDIVRGDLYAEVVLTVPTDLSAEQLEIVNTLINP